jgi:hypothetical protein
MDVFLSRALDEIQRAAGHLGPDALGRPVGPRWSIAEILEHLTLAFALNRTALEKVLASGERRVRRPGPGQWLVRTLVIDIGYFPRAPAPEMTWPHRTIPPDRSLSTIREALIALDETLARAAARFGEEAAVVNHPYFAGLTVRQWRKFHWRHTVHHMRQVRRRALSAPS